MTPSPQHIDGFMHGMEHALKLCERHKRGRYSAQALAVRTELTHLKLLAEQPAVKASAAPAPAPQPAPINRARRYPAWQYVLGGLAYLSFILVFGALFARGVVIESDWRHDRACKYNQSAMQDCQ